jgi:hypothetical protein
MSISGRAALGIARRTGPAVMFYRIAIGYLAAAYCASLMILGVFIAAGPNRNPAIWLLPYFAPWGMVFSVPLSIVPSALFVSLSETFRIRKLPFYLFGGFITGIAVIMTLNGSRYLPDWLFDLLLAVGGALCGCVYWAIAGRKAGLPASVNGPGASPLRRTVAGCVFAAALTGFEALMLHLIPDSEFYAWLLVLCFFVHAAFGAYFAGAFLERRAVAATP